MNWYYYDNFGHDTDDDTDDDNDAELEGNKTDINGLKKYSACPAGIAWSRWKQYLTPNIDNRRKKSSTRNNNPSSITIS
jgi:hypothetical protein